MELVIEFFNINYPIEENTFSSIKWTKYFYKWYINGNRRIINIWESINMYQNGIHKIHPAPLPPQSGHAPFLTSLLFDSVAKKAKTKATTQIFICI